MRHAATSSLFERRDVIIVASVSCIYGLGSPEDYVGMTFSLKNGGEYRDRDHILRRLVGGFNMSAMISGFAAVLSEYAVML